MKSCLKCGKEHDGSYGSGSYCSKSCSHSRVFSEESKQKKRDKTINFWKENPKIKIEKKTICCVCGSEFEYKWHVKTCSILCKNYLLSIKRQEAIQNQGTNNWKTKQEVFNYKFVENITTDSKLEQAAIIYLVDIFKADKIEKYKNILNFWEGQNHRTFNPDFWVIKGGEVYIVEVKMKWSDNSTHIYNRTIPYKKEALQKYCDEHKYKMIWLDFDYDQEFKKIYNK